jgi:arabinose-5-phosphate isomerase
MSMDAALPAHVAAAPIERSDVPFAQRVLRQAADSLRMLAEQLDSRFDDAVRRLLACHGDVIVTGMGKAGHIARKLAATLASTGTRAHYLHPAEALHGDLGRIRAGDIVLALSKSGETEELARILPSLVELGATLVAITSRADSTLGRAAAVVLELGPIDEACHLGLAPSTSTTVMLALGDALALAVSRRRQFGREEFNRFHPGGALGRRLGRVEGLMRALDECRVALATQSVREVFMHVGRQGRRSGAIMLVDDRGRLEGLFTDSDLARLFEGRRDTELDGPIANVMTRGPLATRLGARVEDAIEIFTRRKISELPVLDELDRPAGMLDITDLVGLVPVTAATAAAGEPPLDSPVSPGPPQLTVFHDS